MNPALKNYIIFSAVIAFVVAALLNFGLFANIRTTFIQGFPLSIADTEGFATFIITLINTLIATLFFTPVVYFIIQYLQRGGNGGSEY